MATRGDSYIHWHCAFTNYHCPHTEGPRMSVPYFKSCQNTIWGVELIHCPGYCFNYCMGTDDSLYFAYKFTQENA